MNILIIRLSGFIGFFFAKKLIKNKVIKIANLDSYYSVKLKKKRNNILKKNKNFTFKKIKKFNNNFKFTKFEIPLENSINWHLNNKIYKII